MNLTGTQANQKLSEALQNVQQEAHELEKRLSALTTRRSELQIERGTLLESLATLRLQMGDATEAFSPQVIHHVEQYLRNRDAEQKTIAEKITLAKRNLAQHLATLEKATEQQDHAETKLEEALEAVEDHLETLPKFLALRDRAEDVNRTLQHATEKADASNKEREEKGSEYLSDPLFRYLWQKKFGTTEYSTKSLFGNLVRTLDQWVASLTNYEEHRQNYSRLLALPRWIAQHVEQVEAQANIAVRELEAFRNEHERESNIGAITLELSEITYQADLAEEAVQATEKQLQDLENRYRTIAEGADENHQAAMTLLRDALNRKNLAQLEQDAIRTPYPEDDIIVAKLHAIADELQAVQLDRSGIKDAIERGTARIEDLTNLARDFRQSPMNRKAVNFPDGRSLEDTIHKVLTGLLTVEALSRYLRSNHTAPPPPQQRPFSPPRTTVHRGPTSIGRSRPPSRPSGGGFKTGGGSRGGGFKTGGRF